MEISNASLLDEGTAVAEAVTMCRNINSRNKSDTVFVSMECHPQTISVLRTRAEAIGLKVLVENPSKFDFNTPVFAAVLQYPATDGSLSDPNYFIKRAQEHNVEHAQNPKITIF